MMQYLIWGLVVYLIMINLITFIVFGVDKAKAKNHSWRVPEKTLFLLAIIGGSAGTIIGMHVFRHKTRKWYFAFGIPAILIIQLAAVWMTGVFPVKPADIFPTAIESPVPTEDVADVNSDTEEEDDSESLPISSEDIPEYTDSDTVVFNYDQPLFTDKEKEEIQGESYSELDSLGCCGEAVARLHKSMMPTGERGSIGHIRPSGWHTVKYSDLIKDRYLFNRCHLIAFALTG